MRINYILIFLLSSSFLIGCVAPSRLFQIMEIQSPDCRMIKDSYVTENDTMRIVYMFWAKNGIMELFVHNKINHPIYIDWKKCSFIYGTAKNDFWNENITISSSALSSTESYYNIFKKSYIQLYSTTETNAITQIVKPERITFIPPQTTVSHAFNNLFSDDISLPPVEPTALKDTIIKKTDEYIIKQSLVLKKYSANESPIKFRSYITYSLNENFSPEYYIDNHFYISRILEVPAIFRYSPDVPATITLKDEQINWPAQNEFYIFPKH